MKNTMTKELAERILNRKARNNAPKLTKAKEIEVLMDWLEGMPYRELLPKYKIRKNAACLIIREAKDEAHRTLL